MEQVQQHSLDSRPSALYDCEIFGFRSGLLLFAHFVALLAITQPVRSENPTPAADSQANNFVAVIDDFYAKKRSDVWSNELRNSFQRARSIFSKLRTELAFSAKGAPHSGEWFSTQLRERYFSVGSNVNVDRPLIYREDAEWSHTEQIRLSLGNRELAARNLSEIEKVLVCEHAEKTRFPEIACDARTFSPIYSRIADIVHSGISEREQEMLIRTLFDVMSRAAYAKWPTTNAAMVKSNASAIFGMKIGEDMRAIGNAIANNGRFVGASFNPNRNIPVLSCYTVLFGRPCGVLLFFTPSFDNSSNVDFSLAYWCIVFDSFAGPQFTAASRKVIESLQSLSEMDRKRKRQELFEALGIRESQVIPNTSDINESLGEAMRLINGVFERQEAVRTAQEQVKSLWSAIETNAKGRTSGAIVTFDDKSRRENGTTRWVTGGYSPDGPYPVSLSDKQGRRIAAMQFPVNAKPNRLLTYLTDNGSEEFAALIEEDSANVIIIGGGDVKAIDDYMATVNLVSLEKVCNELESKRAKAKTRDKEDSDVLKNGFSK